MLILICLLICVTHSVIQTQFETANLHKQAGALPLMVATHPPWFWSFQLACQPLVFLFPLSSAPFFFYASKIKVSQKISQEI
jgi:hypothetical protein